MDKGEEGCPGPTRGNAALEIINQGQMSSKPNHFHGSPMTYSYRVQSVSTAAVLHFLHRLANTLTDDR